ncbi:MAG: quinone oxidoreductase [Rhodospirillales bacterium]|nr:quinone oxidoreductase [Rhodospirillales bacterium]
MEATVVIAKEAGGPEVLEIKSRPLGTPGEGQVLLRQTAVGLNYIDTYHRSGLYPLAMPSGIGLEAAGVIEAVGPSVHDLAAGDKVAYGTGPIGAYASARVMPAASLVRLPEGVDDRMAAAMMLKGLTVHYLIRQLYPVKEGETVLFHAAAGGVGLIACQWLEALGARVIGTVGSAEKGALARAHGCHHIINYRDEKVPERVKELTDGEGVPVVFDGVGKDTWEMSLDCLQPCGLMVSFGNASGAVPPVNLAQLSAKGSLTVSRPTLMTYTRTPARRQAMARELFRRVKVGEVSIRIDQTYPLREAEQAHRELEGRKTTGSTVLLP